MIPELPLDNITPLQLGDDITLVFQGFVVVLQSVPREEVRAGGFDE